MKNSLKKAALLYSAVLTAVSALSAFSADAAAADSIEINAANFPDEEFRSYITKEFDKNKDNTLSAAELWPVKNWELVIDVSGKNKIKSLKGIEFFKELTELDCQGTSLDELDISENRKLKRLYCGHCGISSLDVSKNTELVELKCYNDVYRKWKDGEASMFNTIDLSCNVNLKKLTLFNVTLTELDVSNNKELEYLQVSCNYLDGLDVTQNLKLETLYCWWSFNDPNGGYRISEQPDISKNVKLKNFSCDQNGLKSIDVSRNTELEYLSCDDNPLTALDVSENSKLKKLYCSKTSIEELDLSNNKKLEFIDCSGGNGKKYEKKLKKIKLPGTASLKKADVSYNELESLDLTGCNGLEEIMCYENKLQYLDLSDCATLKELNAKSNKLTYLDLSGCETLTELNAESNLLEKVIFPPAHGKVHYRLDNNKFAFLDCTGYDVGFIGWQYPEFIAVNGVFDTRPLEEAGFDPKKVHGLSGIVYDEKTHTMTFDTTRYEFYYYYWINEKNDMQVDPKVTFIEDESNTDIFLYRSDNTIKWAKVKGADKYVLTKYNEETKKWDKLTETDGLSFDDPDVKGWRTYTYCLWVYGNGKLLGHTDAYKMEIRGYETPHGRVYED